VQQFISSYGYLAVFILMLAESACIPVPSELTMLFAGALSAGAVAGAHLNLVLAITAGVAGNVAGSYLAWGIGVYGGRAAWHRWGRYILLRDDDIDRAERWFGRHGTKAVFFGRLLPVVRTFISLPAGLARMPAGRFGIYTVLGCIPWTAALAWTGYLVGANWGSVVSALQTMTSKNIGFVPVLEGQKLVGVLSERDCARRAAVPGTPLDTTPVADIMVRNVITIDFTHKFADCLRLMEQHGIYHLLVVDAGGSYRGMLSVTDLLRVIASDEKARADMLEAFLFERTAGR